MLLQNSGPAACFDYSELTPMESSILTLALSGLVLFDESSCRRECFCPDSVGLKIRVPVSQFQVIIDWWQVAAQKALEPSEI